MKVKVVIYEDGKRVLNVNKITMLHGQDLLFMKGLAHRRKGKMQPGADYIKVTSKVAQGLYTEDKREDGLQMNYPKGLNLFTSSGYMKLMKDVVDEKEIKEVLGKYYFGNIGEDGCVEINTGAEERIREKVKKSKMENNTAVINDDKHHEPENAKEKPVIIVPEREMWKEAVTPENPAEQKPEYIAEMFKLFSALMAEEAKQNQGFRDTTMEILRMEQQKFNEAMKLMTETVEMVKTIAANYRPPRQYDRDKRGPVNFPVTNIAPEEVTNTEIIVGKLELKPYREWREEVTGMAKMVAEKGNYVNHNEVLSNAYKELTKQYGRCWDQLAKEFREDRKRNSYNTLELEYYAEEKNPVEVNLLLAKLKNMYEAVAAEKGA